MIKTVYFDLGNVLIFFSMPKMLSQLSNCTGIPVPKIKQLLLKSNLRELYEKGLIDTDQLYKTFVHHAHKSFSLHEFMINFSDIFTPNTEIIPIIKSLKKEKIRLILLSNTSECHFNYAYSHYPILQEFDHKILSYEMGVWKPDSSIFEKALTFSECEKEECFYTDDISHFIKSARRVGLPGEIYTDVPSLKGHLSERGLHFK